MRTHDDEARGRLRLLGRRAMRNVAHAGEMVRSARAASRGRAVETIALLTLLAFVALASFGQAATKAFWYDELVTLRISSLGSVGNIIHFFMSGKDTTGLLPAMIVHAARHIPARLEVTTRLPFELAYLVTCLCLYGFIRRRYSVGFALSGTLTFVLGFTFYYSTEIRAYGFLLLGAAIAIYCWQLANQSGSLRNLAVIGLFVGLSAAILFHLFAVFLFVPFAVAQWVQDQETRIRRVQVWLALLFYPLSALVLTPSILAARQIYGKTFWSKPSLLTVMEAYKDFVDAPGKCLPFLLIFVGIYLWMDRTGRIRRNNEAFSQTGTGYSASEWTLAFLLSLLPVIAFAGASVLGVYRGLYVMPVFLGLSMLAAGLVAELTHKSSPVGWALAVMLLFIFVAQKKSRLVDGLHAVLGRPAIYRSRMEFSEDWYSHVCA